MNITIAITLGTKNPLIYIALLMWNQRTHKKYRANKKKHAQTNINIALLVHITFYLPSCSQGHMHSHTAGSPYPILCQCVNEQ